MDHPRASGGADIAKESFLGTPCRLGKGHSSHKQTDSVTYLYSTYRSLILLVHDISEAILFKLSLPEVGVRCEIQIL